MPVGEGSARGARFERSGQEPQTRTVMAFGPSAKDIRDLLAEGRPVDLKFLRIVPPGKLDRDASGSPVLPHIRLDRALDFLLSDWLA